MLKPYLLLASRTGKIFASPSWYVRILKKTVSGKGSSRNADCSIVNTGRLLDSHGHHPQSISRAVERSIHTSNTPIMAVRLVCVTFLRILLGFPIFITSIFEQLPRIFDDWNLCDSEIALIFISSCKHLPSSRDRTDRNLHACRALPNTAW